MATTNNLPGMGAVVGVRYVGRYPAAAALAGCSAALLWVALFRPDLFMAIAVPVRLTVGLALAALAVTSVRRGQGLRLWSPLYMLAVYALVFYSLLPALIGVLPSDDIDADFDHRRRVATNVAARYLGHAAEALTLHFSLLCAAASLFFSSGSLKMRTYHPPGGRFHLALTLVVVALMAGGVFIAHGQLRSSMVLANVQHAALPLYAVTSAALALAAARYGGWLRYLFGAFLIVGGILVLGIGAVKQALLGSVPAVLAYLVVTGVSWRRAAIYLLLCGLLGGVAITGSYIHRYADSTWSTGEIAETVRGIRNALVTKILYRQAESGRCLQGVMDQHAGASRGNTPFYFFSALVPRIIWPDKPVLSQGRFYAVEYCGNTRDGNVHDASILLLGEPLIEVGWIGLLVAEAIVLLLLAGISLSIQNQGSVGLTTALGVLPWTTDFDQSFALYVANLLKMALFISPIVLALYWGSRHHAIGRGH